MTNPPPDLTVFSDWSSVTGKLLLFVYEDGKNIGVAELDIKDTMFAHDGNALLQLLAVTRTEPFEEFNKLINGE